MEKKINIKFNIIAIVAIIFIAFALTPITFQNDTYYTIKIGEHILQNGIDMQDPFSWHENLPYTYPHWLYDVAIYSIYSIGRIHRNICFNNCTFMFIRNSYIFYKL